jgi:hypothetical protein
MNTGTRVAVGFVLRLAVSLAHGQIDGPGRLDESARPVLKTEAVEYLFPEQVTVTAGKASDVTLHFRVAQGLHINSHMPKDEYLIPTTFSIPDGAGVRLDKATYPPGSEFTLPLDPTTKACDKNECLPPRTIPVAIDVIGK